MKMLSEVGHGSSRAAGTFVYAVTRRQSFDEPWDEVNVFVGVASSALGALAIIDGAAHEDHRREIDRGANLVIHAEVGAVQLEHTESGREWPIETWNVNLVELRP